jgi:hypothetical protein
MPRIGQNPMKNVTQPYTPQKVTVTTVSYIPQLSGYWAQSLDILDICLKSLRQNTRVPFDLFVFDNGSCPEVREYLLREFERGEIQFLLLSESNVGKVGAWNMMLPAAPGELISFTDSDVLFYPNWLEETLKVFEAYPEAGMVTARPSRSPASYRRGFIGSTLRFAENPPPDLIVERGDLISPEVLLEHARSTGHTASAPYIPGESEDIRMTRSGVAVYAYAGHYQFTTRKNVALQILPLDASLPLGGDGEWDHALNRLGLLRLSLDRPYSRHLGNMLVGEDLAALRGCQHTDTPAPSRPQPGSPWPVRALRYLARYRPAKHALERAYYCFYEAIRAEPSPSAR